MFIYNGFLIDRFGINIFLFEYLNTIDVCNIVDIKIEDLFDSLLFVCDTVVIDLCFTGIDICSFSEDIKFGDFLLLSVEEVFRSLEIVLNIEVCCFNL